MSINEIKASVERFGDRYLDRVYTSHERASCIGDFNSVCRGLAGRFAAKEAAIKALRPGNEAVDWRSIEIRRDEHGGCTVHLSNGAARLAGAAQVSEMSVALTYQGDMAAAVVVALHAGELADTGSTGDA